MNPAPFSLKDSVFVMVDGTGLEPVASALRTRRIGLVFWRIFGKRPFFRERTVNERAPFRLP